MKSLEEKCRYVILDRELIGKRLLSDEEQIIRQIIELKKVIDNVLNEEIIISSLANANENYYTLLYLIIYESDLTYKYKEQIINALLDNISQNKLSPVLSILMLNSSLNDEIAERIIDITSKEYVNYNRSNLGIKPFDYRYHLLKRQEISPVNKEKVLDRYDLHESYYGEDEERQIYYDLEDERYAGRVNTKEYEDEERAYKLIKSKKYSRN